MTSRPKSGGVQEFFDDLNSKINLAFIVIQFLKNWVELKKRHSGITFDKMLKQID